MSQNSRGVIMFAHNNTEIDYFKMAVVNAILIQKNLGLSPEQITVVTDSFSFEYAKETLKEELLRSAIGNLIIQEKDIHFKLNNQRIYKDTNYKTETLSFYNKNRCDAYELSPYDETILLDVDYLVLSNALNNCWGHDNELMMSKTYQDVFKGREYKELRRLNDHGIEMFWATVVYFRKCAYSETFFNNVKHVSANQNFYKHMYRWPGNLYRNDYSFSIAAHIQGGYSDRGVAELPVTLYKSFDNDDIHSVDENLHLILFLEKTRSPGDFILTRWYNVDIHIMNKWAINRVSDNVLEALNVA